MKKIVFIISLVIFISSTCLYAGGVVTKTNSSVYSSILHKEFFQDKYGGESVERWILIQTNIPAFELNSARKEAKKRNERFNRDFQNKYVLEIHQKLLNSFYDGWYFYLLAQNDEVIFRNSINLGNNIYVYKNQPKVFKHKVIPIVKYSLDAQPDIEIIFNDSGNLSFWVTIPDADPSPLYNRFKYRGEKLEKFFRNNVFQKYEERLKINNRYK